MEITQLGEQNPWWNDKDAIKSDDKVNNVIKTGQKIVRYLADENLVLIGPRQLGKTTALKYDIYRRIIEGSFDPRSVLYYSFDTARNFEEITEVINAFVVDDRERILYLDEVSFVDGWQRAIKQFLDSGRSANATVYITGSSSINLRKELMPGRKVKFQEFRPLSFSDFLISFGSKGLGEFVAKNRTSDLEKGIKIAGNMLTYFEEIKKLFDSYIITGGYPDAIFEYLGHGRIGDNLYDTHWNGFVSDISKEGKSVEIATAVVYGIVESYSSKINLSRIARMQGIKSHVTVREYLEAFEDLFVSSSIFPKAERKYIFRKDRKVYFSDPFLYNLFAKKLNIFDKEKESKIVEGIVYNALYHNINKGRGISEPKTSIGFYSEKREVDFIAENCAFEVKWQKEVRESDFPQLDFKNKILLSRDVMKLGGDRKISIIPLPVFLAALY